MRYYEASSRIASSPETVWAVLTDGAAWPSRDSGAGRVDGQIAPGEKITIRSQAAPGRAFPVRVTDFDPPARLRFSGGMPPGLFRGVRTFEVSPDSTGGNGVPGTPGVHRTAGRAGPALDARSRTIVRPVRPGAQAQGRDVPLMTVPREQGCGDRYAALGDPDRREILRRHVPAAAAAGTRTGRAHPGRTQQKQIRSIREQGNT